MSNFVAQPQVQRLIDNFTQELKDLTRAALLDSLSNLLTGGSAQSRLALPPARQRLALKTPSRPRRRLTLKAWNAPALPKPAEETLPLVSSSVLQQVATGLVSASKPITSKELAKRVILGETTVRYALKHLVKAKTATTQMSGRKVLYVTA